MNDPSTNRYSLIEMVMPLVPRFQKTIFCLADKFRYDQIPAVGTKLSDNACAFLDRPNTDGMDNWTFRQVAPHRTDGQHGFIFTAKLTNAQRNRRVLHWWGSDMQPWPAVLEDLRLTDDPNFPVTIPYFNTTTGETGQARRPSIVKQDSYRPAETYLSVVLHEIFISDKPWLPELFPQPQPTPVNWDFQVSRGDYGSCLHDDTTIPAQSLVYDVLINGATSGIKVGSGALAEQSFPATNFIDRAPHVRSNQVEQFQTLYIKHRETVFPKDASELSTLVSS